MDKELKIYSVYFTPIWPVPSGLIIAAYSKKEAETIAFQTLQEAGITDLNFTVTELKVDKPQVIFFESGDY